MRCPPICVLFLFLASNEAFTFNAPSSSASFSTSSSSSAGTLRPFCMPPVAEKRSDRAYIENSLENMMDNDWRVFRAQLVAQEKRDAEMTAPGGGKGKNKPNAGGGSDSASGNGSHSSKDEKLARQGQLGELFAGAISSIFSKPSSNGNGNGSGKPKDIFDGDSVGRYNRELHPENCEDPFVSEQEIPSVLPHPTVTIDKRRWAHEIPHVEAGCVLVANEKLGGVFHQTVVLIVQHAETAGSTGIVINRPLDGDLLKIATECQESKLDLSLKLAFPTAPVTYGGPVGTEQYSILHGFGHVEGSQKLCGGVYLGGDDELMNEVRINRLDPRNTLFVKGHAAWVSGQLSREISKGVWYTAAVSKDFILRYAGQPGAAEGRAASESASIGSAVSSVQPSSGGVRVDDSGSGSDLWAEILSCMGGRYADIARTHASGLGDHRRVLP